MTIITSHSPAGKGECFGLENVKAKKLTQALTILELLTEKRVITDCYTEHSYGSDVTIDDCQKAIKRLAEVNCYPEELKIYLSIFADGDPGECIIKKTVLYSVKNNMLEEFAEIDSFGIEDL